MNPPALMLSLVVSLAALLAAAPGPGAPAGEGSATPAMRPAPSSPPLLTGNTSRYRIGPGDIVRVEVIGHPEFAATAAVSNGGLLVLPILGGVSVQGQTTDELQGKLVEIIGADYVRDPKVLVSIQEYNNMQVWVFGAVDLPGLRRLTGPMTLLGFLSEVSDVRKSGGVTITVERRRAAASGPAEGDGEGDETDTITVDLAALLREGDLSKDIELQNGDKVYLPMGSAALKVGAFGEVQKPGYYPYRPGMTVADLVEVAGGLTDFANPKKIKVKRTGEEKQIPINLARYFKAGDPDSNIELQEGDLVVVGSSLFF